MKILYLALTVALLLLLLSFNIAIAQTTIAGKVIDIGTTEPLQGADVVLSGSGKGIATNKLGEFELSGNRNDSIVISHVGYQTVQIPVSNHNKDITVQLQPAEFQLMDVVVTGYDSNRKLLKTTGAISLVTKSDLKRNNSISLAPVLNAIPGVRADQSHSEDTRISIRGVGVRSRFGIRRLKLYINEIPLTEANGFTRIEGLDISTLGRIEIIKGPASSMYGAALGGVLLFQSEKADFNTKSLETSLMGGSYGLLQSRTSIKVGTDNANIVATYGYQTLDGYRQWSSDKRNFFSAFGQFFPNDRQNISFFVNHSEQDTQIPGPLDRIQFETNPRQADPATLAKKAARYQDWTRLGISHKYMFTDNFYNTTSLYSQFHALDHPLNFAYIRGTYQSYGGRTKFEYMPNVGSLHPKIAVGGEYINGFTISRQFENIQGTEGDIRLDEEVTAIQYSIFGQVELELPKDILVTFGASINAAEYQIKDLLKSFGTDFSGDKDFSPRITPRVGINKVFNNNFAVYANVSSAYQPPVDFEISNPDGSINTDLEPERGTNYEIGTKGLIFNKLNYDIALYTLRLNNELIPQTVAPFQVIYENAGKTIHNGIEMAVSYNMVSSDKSFFTAIKPYVSYSYNDFTFDRYVIDNENFSGNELTGISPHTVNAGVDVNTNNGIYFNANFYYQDRFPILDDNTVFNDSYSILNTKIGVKKKLAKIFEIDIYTGINNAQDTDYASDIELNASSFSGGLPKFFNPSPGRNYYGGASLKYFFN